MTTENRSLEAKLDEVRDSLDVLNVAVSGNLNSVRAGLMGQSVSEIKSVDEAARFARERCLLLVARQQPVARDLRFTMSAIRIGHDYERIQDLVKFLNDRIERLRQSSIQPVIQSMAGILAKIIAMNTLVGRTWKRDLTESEKLSIKHEVDASCSPIYAEIAEIHTKTIEAISHGVGEGGAELLVELVLACRHLTRIVDLLEAIPDEAKSF